jgi:hypothetical protein
MMTMESALMGLSAGGGDDSIGRKRNLLDNDGTRKGKSIVTDEHASDQLWVIVPSSKMGTVSSNSRNVLVLVMPKSIGDIITVSKVRTVAEMTTMRGITIVAVADTCWGSRGPVGTGNALDVTVNLTDGTNRVDGATACPVSGCPH